MNVIKTLYFVMCDRVTSVPHTISTKPKNAEQKKNPIEIIKKEINQTGMRNSFLTLFSRKIIVNNKVIK